MRHAVGLKLSDIMNVKDVVNRLSSYSRQRGDCLEWTKSLDTRGYGHTSVRLRTRGIRACRTHRLSFVLSCGDIADGLLVCHSCDNPVCLNPEHLFLGTVRDNNHDAIRKGHRRNVPAHRKGSASPFSKLTGAQVQAIVQEAEPYHYGVLTRIARKYNVSKSTIHRIVRYGTRGNNSRLMVKREKT